MTSKLNLKDCLKAGLLAGIAAAAINVVLFLIFHSAGVISDSIYPRPNEPLTVSPVVMASLVPAIIASIVFFLFEKFTKNGFKIFTGVSLIVMVLSLYSPFGVIPGVTTGYALVLCMMHIVVALSILYFIRRAKKTEEIKQIKYNNSSFRTI